jgi:hypothetical protein
MKIDIAMALARSDTGTVSTISVLTGPVPRKSRNIAAARPYIRAFSVPPKNAHAAKGTAAKVESPSVSEYAAGLRFRHAVAAKPPAKVLTRPATAVTAPK